MQKVIIFPKRYFVIFLLLGGCSADLEAAPWASRQNISLADAEASICPDSTEDSGVPKELRLSEVLIDPPGADGNNEFIELSGVPCESVSRTYVVSLEGDSESNPGTVDSVIDLASLCGGPACKVGADGLLVITAINGWSKPDGSDATWVASKALVGGGLENGTATLLLLECTTPPAAGDWDTANSGILQLPASCVLLDSVAWLDRASGDFTYSEHVVGPKPAPGAAVKCASSSGGPGWYFGSLSTGAEGIVFAGALPANAPADAILTPGLPNRCKGPDVPGTPSDAGDIGEASKGTSNPGSGGAYTWWQLDVPGTPLESSAALDAGREIAAGGSRTAGPRPSFPQSSCSTNPSAMHSARWVILFAIALSAFRWARKTH